MRIENDRKVKLSLALMAALALGVWAFGCAPSSHFSKPGSTAAERDTDFVECSGKAGQAAPSEYQRALWQDVYDSCMRTRGYVEVSGSR